MKQLIRSIALLITLTVSVYSGMCSAANEGWEEVGIRAGISATNKHEYFHQYEAFTAYRLPWDWRADSGWGLDLQLNTAAGILTGGGKNGFIGSIGPGLTLDKTGSGLALDLGPNFVIMSRRVFGEQDFSGIVQYMAHIGITYRFPGGMGIGYRFQHMSNGNIYGYANPGLDLHMVGVSWHF